MAWLDFSLSVVKTSEEVTQTLRELFPAAGVLAMPPQNWPWPPWPEIAFCLYENESEFPLDISCVNFPGLEDKYLPIQIEVARLFAKTYNCRTICDGSGLEGYGDEINLFSMIVWDAGRSFLANEAGSVYGRWEDGDPVKIIREMKFPKATLDASGEIVNIDWQNT